MPTIPDFDESIERDIETVCAILDTACALYGDTHGWPAPWLKMLEAATEISRRKLADVILSKDAEQIDTLLRLARIGLTVVVSKIAEELAPEPSPPTKETRS